MPIKLLFLLIILSNTLWGQANNPSIRYVTVAPSGACSGAYQPLQYVVSTGTLWGCVSGTWTQLNAQSGGSGAPTDATYITQTANVSLSAEQALSSLTSGMLWVTGGTGVVSTRTITGTANQITVTNGNGVSGAPTISIPTNPTLPGNTTGTFIGNITGNVTGNTSGTAATITGLIVESNTPLTTKGDLLVEDGTTLHRLAVGTDGQVLTADVASTDGVKWSTPTSGGTVTSVGWTGGLVSIATATTTPAFTIAGTSGGIPYFASSSTWATSAALTANLPVIGGGAGAAPSVGTRSGNTTAFVTTTGTQTSGRCVEIDASGNHIASAAGCASGAGTVTVVSSGSLTSTALVTGGGTTTLQTPSATATMDSSGNISTPGSVTSGAGGSAAGALELGQGTARTPAANSFVFQAPTSITTAYSIAVPSAAGTGFLLNTDTSNVGALTFVGSSGTGNVVRVTSATLVTPALGTPSSVTLTNATDLPVATGISGLGTGVATFLGTPSSTNLASAVTGETGSGALMFGTGPTASGLILSDVATGTQCLHANSSGVVSGTGSDCGAGGGGGGQSGWSGLPLTFAATTTQYAPFVGGGLPSATETGVSTKASGAATIANLHVTLDAALGAGATLQVTLEAGTGTATALTCTTSAGGTSCDDTTHSVNVANNDLLSWKLVSSGTVTAGLPQIKISYSVGTSAVGVTSVGFTGGLISVATATTTPAFTVAGTSGGIPYFSSSSAWASSAALTANAVVIGGGAGAAPAAISASTTTTHALFATAGAPAFRAVAAGDIPTLNQNTTGSAATLTTARAIYGNNFDGSAALTQIIASTYGGTGNGFAKFTGPATAERTFTLPNSDATILYSGGALGTPSSGVLTNATGTATGLTSGITNALKSATTTVDVAAATAPSNGQVLTATSSTAATWQTPGGGSGCDFLTPSGSYVIPGATSPFGFNAYGNANTMTAPSGNNATILFHLYMPCSFTPTKIAFNITTAGGAGCKMSVGIYDDSKSLLISSGVLTDVTTVECDSTGTKVLTSGTSPAATGLGTQRAAGWYWVALTSNETTSRVRALWAVTTISLNALSPTSGYLDAAQASTNGALNSSFTTGSGWTLDDVQSVPVIFLAN